MSIYVVVGAGRRVYVILNILLIFLEIVKITLRVIYFFSGTCPLIHRSYFSVTIFVSVTELTLALTPTLTLTLNRPKNNLGELTDKYLGVKCIGLLHRCYSTLLQ